MYDSESIPSRSILALLTLGLVFSSYARADSVSATVAATSPQAIAANPVTNKIYVANVFGSNVTVIDGANNTTATVPLPAGSSPQAVAVNPVTNKIYVANTSSNTVTVIDGTD